MIFVCLSDPDIDKNIELIEKYKKVELRLDLIKPDPDLIGLMISKAEMSICTYRPDGDTDISKEYIMRSIDLGADLVDIEIERDHRYIKEVIGHAKEKKCKVIISYHNNEETPSIEFLESIFYEARNYEPDVVKIATLVKEDEENDRLLSLMGLSEIVVPVPLGEIGKKGRLKAYVHGSPLIYAHPDESGPIAPGQLAFSEYKDMDKILGIIYR